MSQPTPDDNTLKGLLERTRTELSEYIDTRLKLLKLEAYEKSSIATSHIMVGLLALFVFFLIFLLLLATLAIIITQTTGSLLAGFASVTAITILCLVVLVANAKRMRLKLTNYILSVILKIEKDE